MYKTKENAALGEKILFKTLSSGIKCYIIPKKGYVQKQAMLCVNFGSADEHFSSGGRETVLPDGTAHFMEHKMFESESGNIFSRFSNLGGSLNAYTNYDSTCFYFSCTENFDKNLRLLLECVDSPFFTDENVEKEKPIITQEISMYDDDPFWRVFINLMECLFVALPFKKNIAGSAGSIKAIDKNMLYSCYNIFYTPGNMALVCVGDLEPEAVFAAADGFFRRKAAAEVRRIYPDEPSGLNSSSSIINIPVSMPVFSVGFKDGLGGLDICERIALSKIIVDIIAGESSPLFQKLLNSGLIDGGFSSGYLANRLMGVSIFSGRSCSPEKVAELLNNEIQGIKTNGIDPRRFELIKRKHTGGFIRGFNSVDSAANAMANCFACESDVIGAFSAYETASLLRAEDRLAGQFRGLALAVAKK